VGVADPEGTRFGVDGRWAADALEAITDLAVVVSTDWRILHANPYALDLLALEADEVIGRPVSELVHPDDLQRAIEVIGRIRAGDQNIDTTPAFYRLRAGDGHWRRVELNAALVPGPDGDLLVVIGRYSGDHDLQDRLIELFTQDAPTDVLVGMVPEFGRWRQPAVDYAVFYLDDDGCPAATGSAALIQLGGLEDPTSPWAEAVATREERLAAISDLHPDFATRARRAGFTHTWAMPVEDPLHDSAAVVAFARRDGPAPEIFGYALEVMCKNLRAVLRWRDHVDGLRRAARRDPLTGIPNRAQFWALLESLRREPRPTKVGVLYIDLDGFKGVNDHLGHTVGDQVLTEAASRLAAALRPGDAVARIGGDEFAVVCHELATDDAAIAVAERVLRILGEPFVVDTETLGIGASIGIATADTADLDADELLERADRALYEAKRRGRGCWHLAADPTPG
jgi:diguanylate cyclase (GGDEF)-like protein/PAS domain S-box-containing protein